MKCLLLFAIALVGICACERHSKRTVTHELTPIQFAAIKTYTNYKKAIREMAKGAISIVPEQDIPPKYWEDEIKALKPLRVYTYSGANLVVVQRVNNGVEEGRYITLDTFSTSRAPLDGRDGFMLTRDPKSTAPRYGVFDYKRTGKQVNDTPANAEVYSISEQLRTANY